MHSATFLSFFAIFLYSSLVRATASGAANIEARVDQTTKLSILQCETVELYWGNGVHPYTISVYDYNNGYSKSYHTNHTHLSWVVALEAPSKAIVNVTDATGAHTGIGPFSVVSSNHTECLNAPSNAAGPAADVVKSAIGSAQHHHRTQTRSHTKTRTHPVSGTPTHTRTHSATSTPKPASSGAGVKRRFEMGSLEKKAVEAGEDDLERREHVDPESERRRSRMHALHRKRDSVVHRQRI